jgi:hypothetical protein
LSFVLFKFASNVEFLLDELLGTSESLSTEVLCKEERGDSPCSDDRGEPVCLCGVRMLASKSLLLDFKDPIKSLELDRGSNLGEALFGVDVGEAEILLFEIFGDFGRAGSIGVTNPVIGST